MLLSPPLNIGLKFNTNNWPFFSFDLCETKVIFTFSDFSKSENCPVDLSFTFKSFSSTSIETKVSNSGSNWLGKNVEVIHTFFS